MQDKELESIYQAAAESYQVPFDELRHSKLRTSEICHPRFAMTAYIRSQYRYSLPQICRMLGLSSHKSILNRLQAHSDLMDTDSDYARCAKQFFGQAIRARRELNPKQ